MERFYFISYQRKASCAEQWQYHQTVTMEHPFTFIKILSALDIVVILFYKEITEYEYNLFKHI